MAAASASLGNFILGFQGTSGNLQHTVGVSLQVQTNQLPSFSVTLDDRELTFVEGGSAATGVRLSLGSSGNSNFAVNLSTSGLPNEVQATFGVNPLPFSVGSTSLTLTTNSGAGPVNYAQVNVTATRPADGAVASASFLLNITPPVGTLPPIRTSFVRTDGTPAAAVYDASHGVVYASNPQWNRVDVISPQTAQVTSSIPAPVPAALAMTPDGRQLLVGSSVNQILRIDTTSLQVVNRTSFRPLALGSNNSLPYYFSAQRIAPSSNGKVLLGLINSPTAPPSFHLVEWDPIAGSFLPLNPPGILFSTVAEMAGSSNGSKVLVVDYGTGVNLALYDASSDTFPVSGQSPVGQELAIAANPSGTQFAIIGVNGLAILNSQLQAIAEPFIGGGVVYGMQYSADGSRLLISYLLGGVYPIVETFDTNSFSLVGVAPAFSVCVLQLSGGCQYVMANALAADSSGLVFSSFDHGLVFEDASNFQNLGGLPASVQAPTAQVGANEAALNASLGTTLGQAGFDVTPDVWFGNARGTAITRTGGLVSVTAPPSATTGLADIKAVLPDGWMALAPQAFSYGTEILFVGTMAGPPSGNVTLNLVGHGFFGSGVNNTTVTVGGHSAVILPSSIGPSSDPFPIRGVDEIQVTVPAGTPGPADITLTSTVGASTLKAGFTYLPAVVDFPSADKFANVLYDSKRNRLYLSAGNKIDVFDAGAQQYLSPILPPTLSGKSQLTGLALTPDFAKLIAANFADLSVAVINPDNPSSSIAVHIPVGVANSPGIGDVATTSTGKVFLDGVSGTFSGCGAELWELDLSQLQVAQRTDSALYCLQVGGSHFSSTSTGDKVFIASPNGGAYLWDATTDQWAGWQFVVSNNGAASGDGHWFASDYTGLDSQLIENTQAQIPEYFANFFLGPPQGAVPGEKMNASGSLLYQPLLHGVDVIDVNSGKWLRRIALTEQVQFALNAMALDEAGNRLFLITDAGLTVVQMDPPPLSIGYLNPASGPASGGTQVTIRGSGFQPGATVMFGGISAATTFIDQSTLQVITAPLPPGGARVSISNPGTAAYSLDAAFQAN